MNRIQLEGVIHNDPVTRPAGSTRATNMVLAVNEKSRDKEWLSYHLLAAWGKQSDATKSLKKADRIMVVGKMTHKKQEDGSYKAVVDVFAAYKRLEPSAEASSERSPAKEEAPPAFDIPDTDFKDDVLPF